MLSASDSESCSIGDLLAFEPNATEHFHALWLGYTETRGAPWLRAEIAQLYGSIDLDQVVVHTGAEEALFTFYHAVVGPGDHAIVQTPCYQSALTIPRSTGCEVTAWQCRYERGWEPDLDELDRAFKPNTWCKTQMLLFNPFKRTKYLLYTTQAIAASGSSLLKASDRYNATAKRRAMMVTLRDEQFTVAIEPFSIGQRGTGKWMSHLAVEANGRFLPSHDGSVEVTLGFRRGLSASQLGWRLVFYVVEAGAAADALWGRVIFVFGLSLAIILGVAGIPWSLVAYFQGMRQAAKDWDQVLEAARTALASHTVERI